MYWFAAFGVPNGLMSDGPTHFRNETVRLVFEGLRVPHHFTLPYNSCSNGAFGQIGKELLRVFRSIVSELRMDFADWTSIIPIIQSVLNQSPSPHRSNNSPVTVFMGIEPTPPIKTFIRSVDGNPVTLTDVKLELSTNTRKLMECVAELHPFISDVVRSNRAKSRKTVSKGELPNFVEGDYVFVAREEFYAGEKLVLRWRGP